MAVDIVEMIERMAETGTAPADGCSLFGVGYEEAFQRLKRTYLQDKFARGGSSEKFIVGPFGSGKTHFLRHLSEIAREFGCVTAEVTLNKDIDFTKSLVVYRELAREIRTPGGAARGISALLSMALHRISQRAGDSAIGGDRLARAWLAGLEQADFELPDFGRITRQALDAQLAEDQVTFDACCRWLGGDFGDKALARMLSAYPISKSEENLYGRRAFLALCQFVRRAGFQGTVVTFDEAEQGLGVDRKRMDRILSMLQSGINAIADLKQGSVLVVYAFTPDLIESMERLAALQQRVADPGIGFGFFDGNTRAPRIDLTQRGDTGKELEAIGRRLVELAMDDANWQLGASREEMLTVVRDLANEVGRDDPSSSNRRTMVKRTCATLLRAYESGVIDTAPLPNRIDEDEV